MAGVRFPAMEVLKTFYFFAKLVCTLSGDKLHELTKVPNDSFFMNLRTER